MHVKKVTQKDRYGNTMSYEFEVPEKGIDTTKLMEKQMDMMQDMVPPMMDHPGEPMGSDTVPAWLTPGEFVVNAEAMRLPGVEEQVTAINEMGKGVQAMQGGSIPTYHDGGIIPAPGVSNPETDLGFPFPQREGYNTGGWVKEKAHMAIDKMDPAMLTRMMAQMADLYQTAQPVLGFDNGGAVPAPPIAPWTQIPEGTEELLHEREGYVPEIYLDSLGKPTVGYGHLIADEVWEKDDPRIGTQPYSEAELKAFFDQDVQAAQSGAVRNIGRETWMNLNPNQQKVLTSMAFQLGETGQKKFGNMIKAIQAGDYETAAREALTGSKPGTKSKWLKQTPKRAFDLAEAFSPEVAAQYRAAGGAVYLDDGGWGSWLKGKLGIPQPSEVNYGTEDQQRIADALEAGVPEEDISAAIEKHPIRTFLPTDEPVYTDPILGELPNEVPAMEEEEIPYTQTPEFQQHLDRIENEAGQSSGDGDDLGTAPTAEKKPSVPPIGGAQDIPPQSGWISPEVEKLRQLAAEGDETAANILEQNHIDPKLSGGGRSAGIGGRTAEEYKLWQVEQSGEYQAHVARARSTGLTPKTPEEWLESNTVTEGTDSTPTQRAAPHSETVGQDASATVINNGGTAGQANAAATAADEVKKAGGTDEEAAAAGAKAAEEAGAAIDEVVNEQGGNNENTPGDDGNSEADVENKGNEASDTEKKKTESMLGGLFGDLFDSKELARMAVMYLGSRALGYGHGGSIRWAAQNYVKRVDQKVATRQQTTQELLKSGKYTTQSVHNYSKSGDINDLVSAGAKYVPTGETKKFSYKGQQVTAQKVKGEDGGYYWQAPNGSLLNPTVLEEYDPKLVRGTPEYNTRIKSEAEGNVAILRDLQNRFDRIPGKEGEPAKYRTELTPSLQGRKIAEWAADNGVDAAQVGGLLEQAYHDMINDPASGTKRNLIPYLNSLIIREQTGLPELFQVDAEKGQFVAGEKMATINGNILQLMGAQGKLTDKANIDRLNSFWTGVASKWNSLSAEQQKQWNRRADKSTGVTGFYMFAQEGIKNTKLKQS